MFAWIPYLAVSLDSLWLGLVWGSQRGSHSSRLRAAALIGLCDATATWAAHGGHGGELAYAALIAGLGALSLARRARPSTLLIPLLLSVDNLIAAHSPLTAAGAGLSSFGLALLGLSASALVLGRVPERRRVAAVALLALFSLALVMLG